MKLIVDSGSLIAVLPLRLSTINYPLSTAFLGRQPCLPSGQGRAAGNLIIIVSVTEGFAGKFTKPFNGIKPHRWIVAVQIFNKLSTGIKVVRADGNLDGGNFQR